MICRRCALRASRRNVSFRTFSTTTFRAEAVPVTAQTTQATNPRPNDLPAATSTSSAQPFSTPLSHSPEKIHDLPIQRKQTKQAAKVQSSVPAGTVLKGLNFMKNKQDPVALEDSEYPDWLWGVLEKAKKDGQGLAGAGGSETEGDMFSKSKKQRRIAAKALRKQQMLHPEMLQPKIPLYEQSVDLPAGDGTVEGAMAAGAKREELTKTMRHERRRKIKEDNFLKAMG